MAAPSLVTIVLEGWDLAVLCAPCRMIVPLDALALGLARDEHRPISEYRFRCRRCREVGEAIVTAKGNMLMGHALIWP